MAGGGGKGGHCAARERHAVVAGLVTTTATFNAIQRYVPCCVSLVWHLLVGICCVV